MCAGERGAIPRRDAQCGFSPRSYSRWYDGNMEKPGSMKKEEALKVMSELVEEANGLIGQAKKIAVEYGLTFVVADENAVFEGDSYYADGRWFPGGDFVSRWDSSNC